MAREAGITDRQLRHPDVTHLSRDTYLPSASAGEPSARLAAVLLTAPPGAVLSHTTAAALWGDAIPLQAGGPRRVDLTVPMSSRSESRRDLRGLLPAPPPQQPTPRGRFPDTPPPR